MAVAEVNLPPGPNGRWIPTLNLVKDPRRYFAKCVAKYGDPFLIRALNGPVVVTGCPDLVREIFSHKPDDFGLFATETVRPILGEGSLLMMDGAAHRNERKLLSPLFHGDRMKAYGPAMQNVALSNLTTIRPGTAFSMLSVMQSISLEIICRAIFGGEEIETINEMLRASQNLAKAMTPMIFFSKRMQFRFGGWSPWDRFCRAQQMLNSILSRRIAEKRERSQTSPDILTMLMKSTYENGSQISEAHLQHELSTLLFAGHETSAIAMTWCMYHLHKHPDTLRTLQKELDSCDGEPESLVKLEFLKAAIQESLRLNPIVTEVLRLLKVNFSLGGYQIPKGYAVAPAPSITHYREDLYPAPTEFRPHRFLERTFSASEYFPFGGGHRRCIGGAFAMHEMAVVLGTLLRSFQFELQERREVVAVRRSITMGPSTGVTMQLVGTRHGS